MLVLVVEGSVGLEGKNWGTGKGETRAPGRSNYVLRLRNGDDRLRNRHFELADVGYMLLNRLNDRLVLILVLG